MDRSDGRLMSALLDHLLKLIALLRLQATELVLDVEPCLFAQIEQVLAIDLQFPRQCVNPNFLSLQAALLVRPVWIVTFRNRIPGRGGRRRTGPSCNRDNSYV